MTIRITDDEITSTVTTHRATRCPGGWAVTWLGDRTVDRDLAHSAMKIAEFAAHPVLSQAGEISDLVDALGMTIAEVVQLIEDSKPVIHDTHAIPVHDEPADVTTVEYSVRFTHSADGVVFTESMDDRAVALDYLDYVAATKRDAVLMARRVVTSAWLPDSGSAPAAAEQVKSCPSCPHCGKTFHVEDEPGALTDEATAALEAELGRYGTNIADMVWRSDTGNIALGTGCESCGGTPDLYLTPPQAITFATHIALVADAAPAKTHDLTVRKGDGDNLVIVVENEKDDVRVYMPTGFAQDLGVVLDLLTTTQVQLLIGELTGGEK